MRKKDSNEPDASWLIGGDQAAEIRAQSEHLQLLVAHGIYIFLGNLAASSTLVIGTWNRVSTTWLLIWFAVVSVFNVLRWAASRRFPEGQLKEVEIGTWDRRLTASAFFSGCLWGFAGGFFFLPGEPGHNFFLMVLIIGMAAAAATSLAYHRIAYPAFFLPAVTPITLFLILEAGTAEKAVGLVTPFYFLLMYLLSRHIYQAAHTSIMARINSQHLAYYDALTGVANRRAFKEILKKEWLRALRSQQSLSLIITDIDDFKRYNDTYGHAAGDEVLNAVSQMMQGRIRRGTDLVARIGGEEFAVILPETDLAGAQAFAGQILHHCRHLKSGSGRYHEVPTLSAGISVCVPSEKNDVETLFDQADSALYKAKRGGKDRAVSLLATIT
jgi:diguanylate cyclase (GGDEF)-like protein